ncbi:unnamed protein product [Darwinula stevensoni]|uniref:non-specific serine/threonine protein kinase n=1 Tax=Darwinula stevensoni TaxID=69355 RepID=A0A7R9A1N8_9CRUS|nr:unnamed protein product [Darwinula stevensoni]CAG0888127.1 unnamed protein product [Darwinula stevensoni]
MIVNQLVSMSSKQASDPSGDYISGRATILNRLILGLSFSQTTTSPSSSYHITNGQVTSSSVFSREGLLDAITLLHKDSQERKKDPNVAAFIRRCSSMAPTIDHLRVKKSDFEIKKLIGKGRFGEIHVVRERATGHVYAMKTILKEDALPENNLCCFEEERDIMARSQSPWLTALQYAFHDNQKLHLVMEYHPGGDFLSLMQTQGPFPEKKARIYIAEIICAVNDLHNMGYVHRDLKPENILVDRTGHLKLVDFGSAGLMDKDGFVTTQFPIGTPGYLAPEVLESINDLTTRDSCSLRCGREVDYWSVGVIAYELLTNKHPFEADNSSRTYANIMNFKERLRFPGEKDSIQISNTSRGLIKGLLSEVSNRLNYDALVVHPFFHQLDWKNLRYGLAPCIPVVLGQDDTSNFDEVVLKNLPRSEIQKGPLGNSNLSLTRELPFVGFSFTRLPCNSLRQERRASSIAVNASAVFDEKAYEREIQELKLKLSKAEKAKEARMKENEDLLANLKKAEVTADVTLDNFEYCKKECDNLKTEVQRLTNELEREKAEQMCIEKRAMKLLDDIKKKFKREEEQRVENLVKNLEEASKECDRLRNHAKASSEEMLQFQDIIKHLQEEKLQLQAQIHALECDQSQVATLTQKRRRSLSSPSKSSLDSRLDRAISKMMDLSSQCEAQFSIRSQLQKTIEEQVQKVESCETKDLQKSSRKLEAELRKIKEELKDTMAEKEAIVQSLSADKQKFEQEAEKAQVTRQDLESTISRLESREDSLKQEKDQMQIVIQRMEEKMQNFFSRYSATSGDRNENQVWKAQIERLELQRDQAKEKGVLEKKRADDLEDKLALTEKALSTAQLDRRMYERMLRDAEAENKNLKKKESELEAALRAAESSVKKIKMAEQELNDVISEASNVVTEKNKEIAALKQKMQADMETLNQENSSLKSEVQLLQGRLSKITEMEQETMALELKRKFIEEHLHDIQGSRDALLSEKTSLNAELQQEKIAVRKLQKEVEGLKKILTLQEDDIQGWEKLQKENERKIQDLESQKKALEEQLVAQQEEVKSTRAIVNEEKSLRIYDEKKWKDIERDLQMRATELEGELEFLRKSLEDREQDLALKGKEIASLREELNSTEASHAVKNNTVERLSVEMTRLKGEVTELRLRLYDEEKAKEQALTHSAAIANDLEEARGILQSTQAKVDELEYQLDKLETESTQDKLQKEEQISQLMKLVEHMHKEEPSKKRKGGLHFFGSGRPKENVTPLMTPKREVHTLPLANSMAPPSPSPARHQPQTPSVAASKMPRGTPMTMPISPQSRKALAPMAKSPVKGLSTPVTQRLRHNIPHKFQPLVQMKSTTCRGCLSSISIGRQSSKCQSCGISVHPQCCDKLNVESPFCGLTSEMVAQIAELSQPPPDSSSRKYKDLNEKEDEPSVPMKRGDIKILNSKKCWVPRHLTLDSTVVMMHLQEPQSGSVMSPLSETLDLIPLSGFTAVTESVDNSELPSVPSTDLPFVFKVEQYEFGQAFPKEQIFFLAPSYPVKKAWVATLEGILALARKPQDDLPVREPQLLCSVIMPVHCALVLNDKLLMLGTQEGIVSGQVPAPNGEPVELTCLFKGIDEVHSMQPLILKWDVTAYTFVKKRIFPISGPSPALLFHEESVLVCMNGIKRIDLKDWSCTEFLDEGDKSLRPLSWDSQRKVQQSPIGIFHVSKTELLVCFRQGAVFVNSHGRKSRRGELCWNRLPTDIAFHCPYIFTFHYNGIEALKIDKSTCTQEGSQPIFKPLELNNPRILGAKDVDGLLVGCEDDEGSDSTRMNVLRIQGRDFFRIPSLESLISDCSPPSSVRKPLKRRPEEEEEEGDFSFTESLMEELKDSLSGASSPTDNGAPPMKKMGDSEQSNALMAKIDNARNVAQLLKAVNFRDTAVVYVSSNGLKVTVEEAKCVQANAFIQSDLFQQFFLRDAEDTLVFRINLSFFLHCLQMLGASPSSPGMSTALKMCYAEPGAPLLLMLCLQLQIDIPKTSPIVESFTCTKATSNAYRLTLVRLCNRALSTAQKVSLQVDDRGFLCFQFMLRSEEGKPCIVDFFCCPEEEDEDDMRAPPSQPPNKDSRIRSTLATEPLLHGQQEHRLLH